MADRVYCQCGCLYIEPLSYDTFDCGLEGCLDLKCVETKHIGRYTHALSTQWSKFHAELTYHLNVSRGCRVDSVPQ